MQVCKVCVETVRIPGRWGIKNANSMNIKIQIAPTILGLALTLIIN